MKTPSFSATISSLCTPALIYLILSAFFIFGSIMMNLSFVTILIKVFFVLAWTWVLNLLCRNNLEVLSWILVLLPYLFMFVLMLFGFELIEKMPPASIDNKKVSSAPTLQNNMATPLRN